MVWILAGASLFCCVVVVGLNALQIRALGYGKGVDQTYLFESLLSTTRGRFFHHTHAITNRGGWGEMDHFWPTMLLFVPVVALIGHPLALYVVNGLCLAGTGVVVFFLARDALADNQSALLATAAFWSMPETYYVAVTGCWPEVWGMPWLALLFLCYQRRSAVGFAAAAVPFMGTMEQMLGYVGLFAALELVTRRQRRWLLLPVLLALAWVAVLALFADSFAAGRFSTHPFRFDLGRLVAYLSDLFLTLDRSPLAYLALLWPPFYLFSAPPSLVVVGWDLDLALTPAHDGKLRYVFFVFLLMGLGGLQGVRRVAAAVGRRCLRPPETVARAVLLVILAVHLVTLARMAPAELVRYRSDPADELVWATATALPAGSRVAANREIPYAFVGRAGAFVGFFESSSFFRVKELFFDERNTPRGPWGGEEKYLAMGRHTPAAFVLEQRGDSFVPVRALWVDPDADARDVGCVDATGDGRLDVVLTVSDGRELLFENRPGVRFELVARGATSTAPSAATARLRAVGATLDVGRWGTVGLSTDRSALLLWQPSSGPLGVPVELAVGGFVEEVAVADLEADGRPELLLVDSQGYRLVILSGGEDLASLRRAEVAAPPIPTAVDVADLDGDGTAEIVVVKSQVLADASALERFLVHERVSHVFWYEPSGPSGLREHFAGRPGWSLEERAGMLHISRPPDSGPGSAP